MKFHDFSPFYRSNEGIKPKVSGDRLLDNPLVADVQSGASFKFDGADDFVLISDNTAIDDIFDGGGTASVWLNPASDGEDNLGRFLNKDGRYQLNVQSESAGYVAINFWVPFSTTAGNWYTGAVLPIGEWSYVVVVYDADSVGNDPVIYINGVAQSLTESSTPVGARTSDDGQNLYVGGNNGSDRTFDGEIRQLRIHNRALTAAEVRAAYNGQAVPFEYVGASQTELTSGTLTVGKSYRLKDWISGDDFTNVGASSNADDVEFTATGTTPTTWSNSSKVVQIGCVAEYLPTGINSTRWMDTSGNGLNGTVTSATAVNHTIGSLTLENLTTSSMSFAGTASASDTLNAYETGSWTPVYKFSDTSDSSTVKAFDSITAGFANASYVRIGRQVTVRCNYRTSALTVGSTADAADGVVIAGLPYAISNDSTNCSHVVAVGIGVGFGGDQLVAIQADKTSAYSTCLRLYKNTSNSPLDVGDLSTGSANNHASFEISYTTLA